MRKTWWMEIFAYTSTILPNRTESEISNSIFQRLEVYLIFPSLSAHTTKSFLYKKPDGSWLITVDWHELNWVVTHSSCSARCGTFCYCRFKQTVELGMWLVDISFSSRSEKRFRSISHFPRICIYGFPQVRDTSISVTYSGGKKTAWTVFRTS